MTSFEVRTETLGDVARLLQSVVTSFESHVSSAEGTVSGVVNATWVGEDAALFESAWNEWKSGAEAISSSLTGLSAALLAAEAAYAMRENAIDSGFDDASGAFATKAEHKRASSGGVAEARVGVSR